MLMCISFWLQYILSTHFLNYLDAQHFPVLPLVLFLHAFEIQLNSLITVSISSLNSPPKWLYFKITYISFYRKVILFCKIYNTMNPLLQHHKEYFTSLNIFSTSLISLPYFNVFGNFCSLYCFSNFVFSWNII